MAASSSLLRSGRQKAKVERWLPRHQTWPGSCLFNSMARAWRLNRTEVYRDWLHATGVSPQLYKRLKACSEMTDCVKCQLWNQSKTGGHHVFENFFIMWQFSDSKVKTCLIGWMLPNCIHQCNQLRNSNDMFSKVCKRSKSRWRYHYIRLDSDNFSYWSFLCLFDNKR